MKSLRICKSTLSMILAIVMLVSMCTVALVNTSAAEADVAQTGATITGGTTFYLDAKFWDAADATERYAAYFCNGSSAAHWYSAYGPNEDGYYWVTVNAGESHANIIWCRMNGDVSTNDWSARWNQTVDLTWDGSKNLFTISAWDNGSWSSYTPTGGGTTDPDDPFEPSGETMEIYLRDDNTSWEIEGDDAKFFVKGNDNIPVEMDQTIDLNTGKILWVGKVDSANTEFRFYRMSYFYDEVDHATLIDSNTAWNYWHAGANSGKTLYKITGGNDAGSWGSDAVRPANSEDINSFWYGLWIDTRGEGNAQHAVKWYKNGSQYELYVPSYVDLSKVNVYSSFDSFTVDGTTYSNGAAVNLSVGSHTVTGITGTSTTTNLGTLKVYQSEKTASMLMTTKEELFTGTTAGLANANAWPSGSGITSTNFNGVYKDAIETKGSYYFYNEDGEQKNSDTVLKKIKGRGNSTFEASMRIYGKYAYNFNLDKKAELIAGATEAKKWSILANNGDVSMLRNTLVYSIADDLGIKYAPETRLVDLYDNGKYLGSYILTEKVEYGKNTLMNDMKNLDDGNEDANIEYYQNEDIMDTLEDYLVQAETSVTINGQKYTYQYTKSSDETNYPYKQPADYNTYNYLLEFELFNRYQSEASWFVSPRTGQAVVVKYPEFATQDEMEWIISQYEAAESAIYSDNYNDIAAAVDVDSFVKMYLLQELALNLDACATSYYIHNDLNSGKLVSSPVWDYDWGFGAYANGTDSGKKYVYNGSSVSVNSTTLDNPKQMFVKNKALKTDSGDNTKKANYNFQAKLVHNATVWERCQYIWTNEMIDILPKYIDNDDIDGITGQRDDGVTEGLLLGTWLDSFSSSLAMNDARWGSVDFTGDNWGTKITTNYTPRSFNFYVGDTTKAGNASKKYSNAVHYLNDWVVERWNHMSSENGGALYNEELVVSYEVTGASFTATQEEDVVTIRPSATVTLDGVDVPAADISYTVYVDGNAQGTYDFTQNATVTIEEGKKSEIYIVVFPTADPSVSDESGVQEFEYGYIAPDMSFKVMFKSSDSIRYLPYVTVNGTKYPMTKTGEPIKKNATGMQTYSWYEATVTIKEDEAAAIVFTNAYSMRGSITLAEVTADATYYFGVDNLNNGTTAVDLTNSSETVKNFVKSASYMVDNNPEAAGVATTSLDGTIYTLGDTDGSNSISILDATALQRALALKDNLSETGSALADYNLDETKSIMDVTMMQVYLANNG